MSSSLYNIFFLMLIPSPPPPHNTWEEIKGEGFFLHHQSNGKPDHKSNSHDLCIHFRQIVDFCFSLFVFDSHYTKQGMELINRILPLFFSFFLSPNVFVGLNWISHLKWSSYLGFWCACLLSVSSLRDLTQFLVYPVQWVSECGTQ